MRSDIGTIEGMVQEKGSQ